MALHPLHKHELRNVALGVGLLGVIAYVLFHKRTSYVVDTSARPDGQPVAIPAQDYGAPPDFVGLDGNGMPFQAYAPPGNPFDLGPRNWSDGPAMTPDPNQTYNLVNTTCGC